MYLEAHQLLVRLSQQTPRTCLQAPAAHQQGWFSMSLAAHQLPMRINLQALIAV